MIPGAVNIAVIEATCALVAATGMWPVKTAAIQLLDFGGIVRFEIYLFGREAAIMDLNDDQGKKMATLMADARGGSSLLVLRARPDRTAVPMLLLQDTNSRTLFKAP